MERDKNLNAKLKVCDIEVKNYVSELEKENKRLHKEKVKLFVKNLSQKHEIMALKKLQPKVVLIANEIEKPPIAGLSKKA